MMVRKMIVLLVISLFASPVFPQSKSYMEDSVAQRLIADKLQVLNISNYVYLFSDAGTIAILYEADEQLKGFKCYYKGKSGSKDKILKLSKEDKLNFYKCMEIAIKDNYNTFFKLQQFCSCV
jgi:hypothetical protein